ncbi:MAG: cyclopropane-fatty-acyl-phospholipid synthase [Chloroflexi bacterium]|nr:cyclopropane-fatty-acyl-phospholipid synthase [Chloroflexota bacterium]
MINPLHAAAGALILRRLHRWSGSTLRLKLPDGSRRDFGPSDAPRRVHADVHHARFFARLLLGGTTGAGESYMAGEWSSTDLKALLQETLRNGPRLGLESHASLLARLLNAWRHRRRANTKVGSQRNIHAHYDLGNDFYRLFLDESLTYSCARWPEGCDDLATAQRAKMRDICDKLDLGPDHHVLEIGSGWGGFALHAAQTTGCRVTGITISREQLEHSRKRVAEAGLRDRVDIQFCDYRDIDGQYDRVVSIEMFEAVGRTYWRCFFEVCERVLRPGGRMLLQTIAIPDADVDLPYRGAGWISRYIFPGGLLPAMCEIAEAAATPRGDLAVRMVDEIGPHYVRTLDTWRSRFWSRIDDVRRLGFDETFVRMWDFYLATCSAAFAVGQTRDVQVLLEHLGQSTAPPSQVITAGAAF